MIKSIYKCFAKFQPRKNKIAVGNFLKIKYISKNIKSFKKQKYCFIMKEKKKVYMLCPVRGVSDDEKIFLDKYVAGLESSGFQVHYLPRDVEQNDSSGINIMTSHREAMKNSDRKLSVF
jgi:hypothetical protein